ncbi:hypothetical protein DLAC_03609 [Tieghemostelium lacteum]|uniref:Uncharacterized protein n=1 Tax=Tieghemostelium lacteum TaxID=361077 RepID=A0A152A0S6_TIELA|nr:hypothetical protein DLAC_03609 [Tieghemostelium lacteum]|eukprot:KYQ99670.1 hypothetical protein DLAC_03609 [Tieghemostelium lacteum]
MQLVLFQKVFNNKYLFKQITKHFNRKYNFYYLPIQKICEWRSIILLKEKLRLYKLNIQSYNSNSNSSSKNDFNRINYYIDFDKISFHDLVIWVAKENTKELNELLLEYYKCFSKEFDYFIETIVLKSQTHMYNFVCLDYRLLEIMLLKIIQKDPEGVIINSQLVPALLSTKNYQLSKYLMTEYREYYHRIIDQLYFQMHERDIPSIPCDKHHFLFLEFCKEYYAARKVQLRFLCRSVFQDMIKRGYVERLQALFTDPWSGYLFDNDIETMSARLQHTQYTATVENIQSLLFLKKCGVIDESVQINVHVLYENAIANQKEIDLIESSFSNVSIKFFQIIPNPMTLENIEAISKKYRGSIDFSNLISRAIENSNISNLKMLISLYPEYVNNPHFTYNIFNCKYEILLYIMESGQLDALPTRCTFDISFKGFHNDISIVTLLHSVANNQQHPYYSKVRAALSHPDIVPYLFSFGYFKVIEYLYENNSNLPSLSMMNTLNYRSENVISYLLDKVDIVPTRTQYLLELPNTGKWTNILRNNNINLMTRIQEKLNNGNPTFSRTCQSLSLGVLYSLSSLEMYHLIFDNNVQQPMDLPTNRIIKYLRTSIYANKVFMVEYFNNIYSKQLSKKQSRNNLLDLSIIEFLFKNGYFKMLGYLFEIYPQPMFWFRLSLKKKYHSSRIKEKEYKTFSLFFVDYLFQKVYTDQQLQIFLLLIRKSIKSNNIDIINYFESIQYQPPSKPVSINDILPYQQHFYLPTIKTSTKFINKLNDKYKSYLSSTSILDIFLKSK